MSGYLRGVRAFLVDDDGPTAVEYAVMLALIVMICFVMIQAVGTKATQSFAYITDHVVIE